MEGEVDLFPVLLVKEANYRFQELLHADVGLLSDTAAVRETEIHATVTNAADALPLGHAARGRVRRSNGFPPAPGRP